MYDSFSFRQNEQGQLEAIPETIHLLLNEGEDPLEQVFENEEIVISNTQQYESDQDAQENDTIHTESSIIDENQEDYRTFIKGEPCEQIVNQEENFEQQGENIEEDTIDVKPGKCIKIFWFITFDLNEPLSFSFNP